MKVFLAKLRRIIVLILILNNQLIQGKLSILNTNLALFNGLLFGITWLAFYYALYVLHTIIKVLIVLLDTLSPWFFQACSLKIKAIYIGHLEFRFMSRVWSLLLVYSYESLLFHFLSV